MPRRFALLLVALLLLLLTAFLLGRRVTGGFGKGRPTSGAVPTPHPTPQVPPTPIPARRVVLWFEAEEDGRLHPEARDLPAASDPVALLRAVASAVLEGPRKTGLLRPFPEGWRLRAAYRMKDGLAVLDFQLPTEAGTGPASPAPRWEAGSREEWMALQSLVFSAARNLPDLRRFAILVAGEPTDTLGGHVDLSHPVAPDASLAVDEAPGDPPAPMPVEPTPSATPTPTPGPAGTPRRPAPVPRSETTA